MTGVFDSGLGGIKTAELLRANAPSEDIIILADRANAPYGKKSKDELVKIVNFNIQRLLSAGAQQVLIACCTAGSVYGCIRPELRARAVEIITPTAKAAAAVTGGRISVIATDATVKSRAFSRAILDTDPGVSVSEFAAQELVYFTEGGCRDGHVTAEAGEYLDRLAERLASARPDTLILGCTHFPLLSAELSARLPEVRMISSAKEGARAMAELIKAPTGNGRLIYTN